MHHTIDQNSNKKTAEQYVDEMVLKIKKNESEEKSEKKTMEQIRKHLDELDYKPKEETEMPLIERELKDPKDAAKEIIQDTLNERQKVHGNPYKCSVTTRELMEIVRHRISPEAFKDPLIMETFHMIFHKMARMIHGNAFHPDHVKDISGYAWILYEELEKQKYSGKEKS